MLLIGSNVEVSSSKPPEYRSSQLCAAMAAVQALNESTTLKTYLIVPFTGMFNNKGNTTSHAAGIVCFDDLFGPQSHF